MTGNRRAVAAAIIFLMSGALAGIALQPTGVTYRLFGLTEGIFALFLVHVMLDRRAWIRPPGVLGWVTVVYGFWATAQLLELLFPPPGVLEWLVVTGVAVTAWAALANGTRERLLGSLATLAILLALLNYSVVPILWDRAGPAPGEAFGLGNLAEGLRQLVVAYQPVRPESQVLGVVAIALWAAATRMVWVTGD